MKRILYLLSLLTTVGCGKEDVTINSSYQIPVTITLQSENFKAETRSLSESAIKDVNIFLFNSKETKHLYSTGLSAKIEVLPGVYQIYAIANMGQDLGNLSKNAIDNMLLDSPIHNETFRMFGATTATIHSENQSIPITIRRHAAKIAYNIAVDPSAGDICITSVQLCHIPGKEDLILSDQNKTDSYGFHDSDQRKYNNTQQASGIFYMFSNRQPSNPSISSESQKNAQNAPENASFFKIRALADGGSKRIEYKVYLGQNNTSDFSVLPNTEQTYNIRIHSANNTDTRISFYAFEFHQKWPHSPYCHTNDTGEWTLSNENTSDYTFSGKVQVLKGDPSITRFIINDQMYTGYGTFAIPSNASINATIIYEPVYIYPENSRLEYQITITDNTGEEMSFTAKADFANFLTVHYDQEQGIVSMDEALHTEATQTSTTFATNQIYGTLTARAADDYKFDGWYDKSSAKLLSSDPTYKHKIGSEDEIVAKFTSKYPPVYIVPVQDSNNSTFMYKRDNIFIVAGTGTGPLVTRITEVKGGIVTSPLSIPGQDAYNFTVKFIPTQVGETSYKLTVEAEDGKVLASKTVSSVARPTKLTPSISVTYDDDRFMADYEANGKPASWHAYHKVIVKVAFLPELDYPEPLKNQELLQIQIAPAKTTVSEVGSMLDDRGQWVPVRNWLNHADLDFPNFATVKATYAATSSPKEYTLISNISLGHSGVFCPYTSGQNGIFYLPDRIDDAIKAKMTDRYMVEYKVLKRPEYIQLSRRPNNIPVEVETSLDKIQFSTTLN